MKHVKIVLFLTGMDRINRIGDVLNPIHPEYSIIE